VDGFVKSHGVFEEYTLEDLEEERRTLKELGSKPVSLVVADTGPVN
jgi:hypothetical protein